MSFARHDFASIKAAFDRVKLAFEEVEKHSDETRDDIVSNSRRKLLPISICLLEGLVEDNENKFKDAQKHCDSAVLNALESGYDYHSEKFFQYKGRLFVLHPKDTL